ESVATIPPSLIVTSVVSLNNYTQCPTLAMLSRMPNTAVAIKLQAAERAQLQQWESSHGTPQQVALRCRIILAALAGQGNVSIAVDLGVSRATGQLLGKRVGSQGISEVWEIAPGRGRKPQYDQATREA